MITLNKLERIMKSEGKDKREYHDLGPELVKKIPHALNNTLDIIKSKNNSYVLTTKLADKNEWKRNFRKQEYYYQCIN